MARVSEPGERGPRRGAGAHAADGPDGEAAANLLGGAAVAVVVGAGLVAAGRENALALLIAVALIQAAVALAWTFGTAMPGRIGGLLIAAAAAATSDVVVSVWPHGRLGALLVIYGLAVPLMFVHQLARSAARVRIVESLSGVALLVAAVTSLPALVQLRHEFSPPSVGGHIVAGVVAASAGALVVGCLVDMIMPVPRFDAAVPRGLLAVVAAAGLGGSVGHLALNTATFGGTRGAFVGAALGALIGFFAVAVAFAQVSTPVPNERFARRLYPVLATVLPLSLIAPVAFLLCLAIRA